jgi:gamma-resorcylate decarboxylase
MSWKFEERKQRMDGKIALEEHFSTQMNDRLWDSSGEAGRNGPGYARDVERRLVDLEACVFEMDRAGIEMCIMSLTSPGVQSVTDPGKALALARDANDYATSFIKAHPDRLSSFAAVPIQNPKAAADELSRGFARSHPCGITSRHTGNNPRRSVWLHEADG